MSVSVSVNSWIILFHHYTSIGIENRVIAESDKTKEAIKNTEKRNAASKLTATTVATSKQEVTNKVDGLQPILGNAVNKILGNAVNNKYSRVVFVDDDSLTNMLNKKIIQSIIPNIPINTFMEVDEALNFLKETDQKGDILIFLDINFPIKNGWDFLEEYQLFITRSTVIMLSSSIDQQDNLKSKQYAQVIDYVSKPLSFEYVAKVFK